MSLRSDIIMSSFGIDVEGDRLRVQPKDGSLRFLFDSERGQFSAWDTNGTDRAVISGESGWIRIRDSDEIDRIVADGRNGRLALYGAGSGSRASINLSSSIGYGGFGAGGANGRIAVLDGEGDTMVRLDATRASVETHTPWSDSSTIELQGRNATISVGGGTGDPPTPGTLEVLHGKDNVAVEIDGEHPRQYFYDSGERTISLDGRRAAIDLGTDDTSGSIELVSRKTSLGTQSEVRIEAKPNGAALQMKRQLGDSTTQGTAGSMHQTVYLTDDGWLKLGDDTGKADGEVRLTDTDGETRVQLLGGRDTGKESSAVSDEVRIFADGKSGELSLGGNGRNGRLDVLDSDGRSEARLTTGILSLGSGRGSNVRGHGEVHVFATSGVVVGRLNGADGSLTLGGGATDGKEKSSTTSVEGEDGVLEFRTSDGDPAGSVEVEGDALVFRDAGGTAAMRIETDGTVKTAKPVERL